MIPTSAPTAAWRAALVRAALPLALATACLLAASLGEAGRNALRYEREALTELELWRVLTAHLVHLGPAHLALNLLGLVAVWALGATELRGRPGWLAAGCSALVVSAGLLIAEPAVAWYVGLSGVLHGLLAASAWRAGGWFGATLGIGLVLKLVLEALHGGPATTEALIGAPVVVAAHLYGAVGGSLAALLERGCAGAPGIMRRRQSP